MAVYNYAPYIFDNVCFSAVIELENTYMSNFLLVGRIY